MALINTVRKHSGLLVGITAIGLILFLIGGDMVQLGSVLSGKHKTDVGEVAGQKITLQAYQAKVEKLRRLFLDSTDEQEVLARDRAWQQLTAQIIYQKECDALGLMVSEDELVDMVQGEHIHPELQVAFQNPETKQFDKQQVTGYLKKLAQMPDTQQSQWQQFESEMATLRQREKFIQLMVQSACVTELEAQTQHNNTQATRHVKCLYVPYHTRLDDTVQIDEKILKKYLREHKSAYQVEESRSVQYVTFPVTPTEEDTQAFQEELQALKQSFSLAKEDRAFAKVNTDGGPSQTYFHATPQQLPAALATRQYPLKKGSVVGPVQEGNVHKLYKVTTIDPQTNQYGIAVIEKQLTPSEQARDQVFRKADYCACTVNNAAQLKAYATQEALQLHEAQVSKNAVQIGDLSQTREMVRWLYNDAIVGQVSSVFELDNEYVVAVMTKHVPSGTAPLEQVRDEISLKVVNEHKALSIMTELQKIPDTTLEAKITQYGEGARLLEIKALRFDDNILQGAGTAQRAVGTAFGLYPGVQATVADDNGVLIVEVVSENSTKAFENIADHQQKLQQLDKVKQPYRVFQALKELAQIKDNRYKFY
jgi:peptidyl-prolyl cis-trans isomerase D